MRSLTQRDWHGQARLAAGLLLVGALAACATLGPRLVAPEVRLATIRLVRVAPPLIELDIGLTVANPNPVAIDVAAIDIEISLEGEKVADARLKAPVTVAAGGSTVVGLDARGDTAATLGVLGRVVGGGRTTMRYELAGVLTQGDGLRRPFTRRGEIPAPGLR